MAPQANLGGFLAKAAAGILILSLTWGLLGVGYNTVVLETLSVVLPSEVSAERAGWGIEMAASPASGAADGRVRVGANAGMVYGLIIALAVLIAAPRIKLCSRLFLLLAALSVAFFAHLAGFYVLGLRLDSVADTVRSGSDSGVFERDLPGPHAGLAGGALSGVVAGAAAELGRPAAGQCLGAVGGRRDAKFLFGSRPGSALGRFVWKMARAGRKFPGSLEGMRPHW